MTAFFRAFLNSYGPRVNLTQRTCLETTGGDRALGFVFGDGLAALPSETSVEGDATGIKYTLTLTPEPTQSLLNYGAQSTTAAGAIADLESIIPLLIQNPKALVGYDAEVV